MGSAVAVDIGKTGIVMTRVIVREEIVKTGQGEESLDGAREDSSGLCKNSGSESSIKMGFPKEKPVGEVPG